MSVTLFKLGKFQTVLKFANHNFIFITVTNCFICWARGFGVQIATSRKCQKEKRQS